MTNGYLILDIAAAVNPTKPELEAGLFFFFSFGTERGRRGLQANRRALTKLLWSQMSPGWHFDDATFDRTARAFDNDSDVDVVIHFYRHRLGLVPGYTASAGLEQQPAKQPPITVPTDTLRAERDPQASAPDGTFSADHFVGPHTPRRPRGAQPPQECPRVFADAVLDVADRTPAREVPRSNRPLRRPG